jgi:hypothetical protein
MQPSKGLHNQVVKIVVPYSTCVDVYIAAYEYAPNPALNFIYMNFYRARIPSPLPLRVAKTSRNHLNEEFNLINLGHAAPLRRCELPYKRNC